MEETKNNRWPLSLATKLSNERYLIERLIVAGKRGALYRALDPSLYPFSKTAEELGFDLMRVELPESALTDASLEAQQ